MRFASTKIKQNGFIFTCGRSTLLRNTGKCIYIYVCVDLNKDINEFVKKCMYAYIYICIFE